MILTIIVGVLALVLSLILTPIVRDVFLRMNVVDLPDQDRKLHSDRIPRVGGIAVFVSYICACVAAMTVPIGGNVLVKHAVDGRWWLLTAITVVFLTGLLDDLVTLRPKHKLVGQILAAILVWCGGIQLNLFHDYAFASWISLPLTVLWLVGCTNAFNLIDGLDGLASGAGLFATLTMIVAAIIDHNVSLAIVTIPLAGALLGFLRYNFNPASIFLGDCGSLTIGFMLGCFGMMWGQKITTFLGLSAPLMAVSLPLLDTSIAIVRRFIRNKPIFSPDRGHIHHRLLDRGNSPRQAALLLYAASALAAVFSLVEQTYHKQFGALIVLLFCAAVWGGVRYLGYREFGLARRLLSRNVMFGLIDDEMRIYQLDKQLRESRSESEAVSQIIRTCTDFGFSEVFVIGRAEPMPDKLLDLGACQVNVPIDRERVLVLHGPTKGGRPIPIGKLASVIKEHYEDQAEEPILQNERLISVPVLECDVSGAEFSFRQVTHK